MENSAGEPTLFLSWPFFRKNENEEKKNQKALLGDDLHQYDLHDDLREFTWSTPENEKKRIRQERRGSKLKAIMKDELLSLGVEAHKSRLKNLEKKKTEELTDEEKEKKEEGEEKIKEEEIDVRREPRRKSVIITFVNDVENGENLLTEGKGDMTVKDLINKKNETIPVCTEIDDLKPDLSQDEKEKMNEDELSIFAEDKKAINALQFRVFEKKRIRWGSVRVINFEKTPKVDPEIEKQLSTLEEKYQSNEANVVLDLVEKEYAYGHLVAKVSSSGIKLVRWLNIENDHIYLREGRMTGSVEIECFIGQIKKVILGNISEGFRKLYERIPPMNQYTHYSYVPDENRCLVLELPNDKSLSVLFSNCYQRNSFCLLVRIKKRILKGEKVQGLSLEDALTETEKGEEGRFLAGGDSAYPKKTESEDEEDKEEEEEENLLEEDARKENEERHLKLLESEALVKFCRGVRASKVTSKGQKVRRCVTLVGENIRVFCEKKNRGQVLGIHDDILKITSGFRSREFAQMLSENPSAMPPANQCATLHMAEHRCCLIFDSEGDRDLFVFLIRRLKNEI